MIQFDRGFAITEPVLSASLVMKDSVSSNKRSATSVDRATLRGMVKQNHLGLISLSCWCNSNSRTSKFSVVYEKDCDTQLAIGWHRTMRVNNVLRHTVPHRMNAQLRRYPESPSEGSVEILVTARHVATLQNKSSVTRAEAKFRAPSLTGRTLGLTAQAAQSERSNRSGSTIFLSGRAQSKKLNRQVIGGTSLRELRKPTTGDSADFV